VPLCKQGQTGRGVALALLFGAGLTVTLTVWGVAIGSLGGFFGLREIARYLSLLGGAVAYVLGLRTLALLRFPLLSGSAQLPRALHGRSEYLGAFALGLLLGNMGLCCPDPVFLSMIPFLAARDRIMDSAVLAAAYGLGRATPLVAVVMLASAGVDSLQLVTRHKQAFDRALGWGLVAIGTLMVYGYSSLPQGDLVAVLLMGAPVVAYHVKAGSPRLRATTWLVAAITGTLAGLRVVRLVLLNLP